MKRFLAVLAATLIAPTLVAAATPAAAQAAPRNPVAAVQKQVAKKSGVRINETTRVTVDGKTLLTAKQVGVVRLDPRRKEFYDVTGRIVVDKESVKLRILRAGGKEHYLQSPLLKDELPEGKTWVSTTEFASLRGLSTVDGTNPKVLKVLLAGAKSKVSGGRLDGVRTVAYRGTIPVSRLAKVSPNLRDFDTALKGAKGIKPPFIRWKLYVGGRDGLPRRLSTELVLFEDKKVGSVKLLDDVRYSGWGTKVKITAPPADQVIDLKELTSGDIEEVLIPFADPFKGLKLDTIAE
ncbi:hypothetical protein GCM10010106_39430 [Thermopolyspora flexuosa]|jgi:hypothetical protein|uniref:Outer membrane lipoprotein-sorting protein n=1 Tax=Thermopolyspora flexuosa TaxID=103836 RepID=A0A543J2D3_9ACTN|nr:hypothetical protein [Thermopolyspora flexuosa]TQM76980.1 hypothetical protein FHX40_3732 [Thermopolyspora flexuosa]GGM88319.1 hypothetical protein GCM10010106_39430 [Thermopolyspora flexuosa]